MARYIGPVCRLCRREGMKLFLKGERCYTEKCAVHAPAVPAGPARPGADQALASTRSAFARSRRSGASTASSSAQFRKYYFDAARRKGRTGEEMLGLLESAPRQRRAPPRLRRYTRSQARQLVRHGHVLVNGKSVDIPSYLLEPGRQDRDPREEPEDQGDRRVAGAGREARPALVARARQGELRRASSRATPVREELNEPAIREQYVVEYY